VPAPDQDEWLLRSIDAAFACGASVVSLVPTRPGNGAVDALAASGLFHPPTMDDVERSAALALSHAVGRERIFVDVWDLDRRSECHDCAGLRRERLHEMNLQQRVLPPVACASGAHPVPA
jgi:archaeosine synthase beta-subunit